MKQSQPIRWVLSEMATFMSPWMNESEVEQIIELIFGLFVLPHGLTDLYEHTLPRIQLYYGASFLLHLLMPRFLRPVLLAMLSVLHFEADVGGSYASLLVLLLIALKFFDHERNAFLLLAMYMVLVHLPHHYTRCAVYLDKWAWTAILMSGTVGWGLQPIRKVRQSSAYEFLASWLVSSHVMINL